MAEATATFVLAKLSRLGVRHKSPSLQVAVAVCIVGLLAQRPTSFASSALTIARSLSDTFAGIAAGDVLPSGSPARRSPWQRIVPRSVAEPMLPPPARTRGQVGAG